MSSTLITPSEVIDKGRFDQNFDPNLIEPFISIAEYRYLASHESHFGKALYEALLQDIILHSEYSSSVIYNIGDVVVFDGKYFVCITNGITGQPPIASLNWQPTSKFNNSNNQVLWSLYLQEFIALAVQHGSTYKNAFRTTSKGIMRNEGEYSKPAEYSEVKALKDELMADLDVLREKMMTFLQENKSNYPAFKSSNCSESIKQHSGIGLYLKEK